MRLTWRRQTLRPKHRFATSQGGIDQKETLVVELEHAGVVGRGEIVPSRLYGQSLEASEQMLGVAAGQLGDDPFRVEAILARLLREHDAQRAAVAGVESALYDWIGQKFGAPVWRLLGLDRPRVRTTFTIGLAELDEIRVKVREALAAGFTALKVKIGGPQDHEILGIIREQFEGPLLLDANEAWSPEDAACRIRALAPYQPAMIEQPLPKNQWKEMARLRGLGVAPLFVDESCERPADVVKLQGLVDGVNIKFTKCGGIREALKMITLARGLGMQVMLGCFVCSSLAIAPALSIATLVDFADLDGALLLADDPFGGIDYDAGVIALGERPGLGVSPRAAARG